MVSIVSGYIYPIRGIYYLLKKKQLRKNSYLPIFFSLIIDLIALVLLFKFTYTPQYNFVNDHILTFFWTWLNKVITFVIVIIEVYIAAMIVINIFLCYFFEKTFDQVLVLKGCDYLLEQDDSTCIKSLLRNIRLFQLFKIIVAIITLPLNFIPTFGSIAYYFFNGIVQAWDQQDRYFELKKIDSTGDQWKFIKSHFRNMVTFGVVSFFLESLPIIGVVFNITNAVGIALFDCKLEKKSGNTDGKSSDVGSDHNGPSSSEEQLNPKKSRSRSGKSK